MLLASRLLAVGIAGAVLAGALHAPVLAAPATAATAPSSPTADAPTADAHTAEAPAAGAPTATSPTAVGAAAARAATAKTSKVERRRVDRVKTPRPRWYRCFEWAQCATVKVPLDYDRPNGKQTTLALLRVKAKNQKAKIGSLFVNPGGPGGSATAMALASPLFLSDAVLNRFDIVGMDPRGIGFSSNVKCFTSTKNQTIALAGFGPLFPYGRKEEAAFLKSAKALGKGCSTGKRLAGAMSTAEVARDMDVMRRAVGDKRLSFLGFSYGSALGQYYANMFPDRFRAVAIDGVINPVSWVGTKKTRNMIQDDRLRSADGAYRALAEILKRCQAAGEDYCEFAAHGDPASNFAVITNKLKAKPLVLGESLLGGGPMQLTYADFIGIMLSVLYSPSAGTGVDIFATMLWTLLADPGTVAAPEVAAARAAVRKQLSAPRSAPSRDFPYANDTEAFSGVMCTDGLHPADGSRWPALAAKADKRAPYFGRAWAWASVPCARNSWTVRDEDAYRGPFTKRTAAPVLLVGSYWDPATNYREAVSSAALLPNSRLLSSNNWGHTAYGTSACATGAIDAYLLRGVLPAKGKTCIGDEQPFTQPLLAEDPELGDVTLMEGEIEVGAGADQAATMSKLAARGLPAEGAPKQLPPVAGRMPSPPLSAGA